MLAGAVAAPQILMPSGIKNALVLSPLFYAEVDESNDPPLIVSGNEVTDAIRSTKRGGTRYTVITPQRSNRAINSTLAEGATVGWSNFSNATITSDPSTSFHGAFSAKLLATAGGNSEVELSNAAASAIKFNVLETLNYVASIYVKAGAGVTAFAIKIRWYTSGDVFISDTALVTATLDANWQRVNVTGAAPATAAKATVIVRLTGAGAGDYYFADAFQFEYGTVPSTFIPTFGDAETIPAVVAGNDTSFGLYPGTTQLIVNSTFDTDILKGWGTSLSTIARVLHTSAIGNASLACLTTNAIGSGVNLGNAPADMVPVQAGQTYVFSLYARLDVAGSKTFKLHIEWYDNANAQVGATVDSAQQTLNTIDWSQRFYMSALAPVNAVKAKLTFQCDAAQGVFVFYTDAWQLEIGEYPTPIISTDPVVNILHTNIGNTGFELGTTAGWNAYQGALTVTALERKSGNYSGKYVTNGTVNAGPFQQTLVGSATAGTTYTASGYVKGPIGSNFRIQVNWLDVGGSIIGSATFGAITAATGIWQRLSVTAVAPVNTSRLQIFIICTDAVITTFYVDDFQVEANGAVSNYSTVTSNVQTRSDARVYSDNRFGLTGIQGAIAIKFRTGFSNTVTALTSSGAPRMFQLGDTATDRVYATFSAGVGFQLFRADAGGQDALTNGGPAFTAGQTTLIGIFAWKNNELAIKINNGARATGAAVRAPALASGILDIGNAGQQALSRLLFGEVLAFATFTGYPDDTQATTIYNAFNSGDVLEPTDLPANCTMVWTAADEYTSQTFANNDLVGALKDLSPNERHALQAVLSKQPQYKTTTTIANARPSIFLDGVDDYLEIPNAAQLMVGGEFSLSICFRPNDVTVDHTLISFGDNLATKLRKLAITSTGKLYFTNFGTDIVGTTTIAASGIPYIAHVIRDSTGVIRLYLNGALEASASPVIAAYAGTSIYIGTALGVSSPYQGYILGASLEARAITDDERIRLGKFWARKYSPSAIGIAA